MNGCGKKEDGHKTWKLALQYSKGNIPPLHCSTHTNDFMKDHTD